MGLRYSRYAIEKPPIGAQLDYGYPLSQGLVGCWLMNEGGGGKINDLTGNRNNGSFSGTTSPLWKPSQKGTALKFDGSNDVVLINDSNSLDITKAITISTWVYYISNTSTFPRIIGKESSNAANPYVIEIVDVPLDAIKLFLNFGAGELESAVSVALPKNIWTNVIVTWNGTTGQFYFNGIKSGSPTTRSGTMSITTSNVRIGNSDNGNRCWNGLIANTILWNRALSPSEIQQLYQEPYCFIQPLRKRRWYLSQGTSVALSGTITAATTETDIVNGGKTIILTLTNDTWIAAGALSFDAQRQNIINGLTSAQSEALGWNNVVKALQGVTGVIRTSDTVVTITLDAQALYDITVPETITATIPATAVTGNQAIVASPTFNISQVSIGAFAYMRMGKYW